MTMPDHQATVGSRGLNGGDGRPPVRVQLIYDANNWLRRRFEGGASIRVCLAEVKARPGTFVFDGQGALRRRRKIYPAYKSGRKLIADDMHKQFELFRRVLTCVHVPCVRVEGWEADDVIATLVRLHSNPTIVKSTDVDFLQLPNVTIDREKPFPIQATLVRTYKSSVGDKSDNIPGIKNFGPKTWDQLPDKPALTAFFEGKAGIPIGLPKSCQLWLEDEVNTALVRSFFDITQLYS